MFTHPFRETIEKTSMYVFVCVCVQLKKIKEYKERQLNYNNCRMQIKVHINGKASNLCLEVDDS